MSAIERIETSRLVLRPSSDERDLATYLAHLTDPDEFFMQFGVRINDEVLRCVDFHSSGVVYYTVFSKALGAMVGYVGILPYEASDGVGELEFHIFREQRGNGYCTEASEALLGAYFDGSLTGKPGKKAVAETMPENKATRKVLDKLGFERTSVGMAFLLSDEVEPDPHGCYSIEHYELDATEFSLAAANAKAARREELPKAS